MKKLGKKVGSMTVLAAMSGACESPATGAPGQPMAVTAQHREGRISARPAARDPAAPTIPAGVSAMGLRSARDTWMYVPKGRDRGKPGPVVVLLHGAGGEGKRTLGILQPLADAENLLLVAPTSARSSWDLVHGALGPDVATVDAALSVVFARFAVAPRDIAIGGFSDGASYALSLGLANGALFSHVIAFSPGFAVPPRAEGKPRVYVSHGTQDEVLPIDACSRRIVPRLEARGYDVEYEEFDGPHRVPDEIARAAVSWMRTER